LFFYGSVHGAMAHVADFMLAAMFIYFSIHWINAPNLNNSVKLGMVGGLLVLIRPINLLFFLFFMLFRVVTKADFVNRIKLFITNYKYLLLIAVIGVLCFTPQLLYWKHITGHFFFNSYVGERFYFDNPHILEGLFGFRKGWMIYSPIMIFSLVGMVLLFKKHNDFALPLLGLTVIYVYIVLSWWCWWYGGSWGLRAMIDVYPFLAIAFAVYLQRVYRFTTRIKRTAISVLLILVIWNLFQTLQYRWGIIHYDGMTREAYFDALFRITKSPDLEKLIKIPDYEKAKRGEE
jgi:hypothetical protein